jgi:hypothetical protein
VVNDSEAHKMARLQSVLLTCALLNLVLVAATGAILRSVPVFSYDFFSYADFLHGHSHFAFGGWITPVLLWIMMRYFPELKSANSYIHWRNIVSLLLISAYGMLFSFPMQGYGPVSIIFSTLSILSTFYLAALILKSLRGSKEFSHLILKAAAVFAVFSALGPFATGPLIAMGEKGTPLYYNAVYFYLHFQVNGFFQLIVIAAMVRMFKMDRLKNNTLIFYLLVAGSIFSVTLSFLWNQPGIAYNIVGGIGAISQLAGVILFVRELRKTIIIEKFRVLLVNIVYTALLMKSVLQCFSAFQSVADFAFMHRDIIVAHLHLTSLGVVTVLALLIVYKNHKGHHPMRALIKMFLLTFIITETIMVTRAFYPGTITTKLLFWFSVPFPVITAAFFITHFSISHKLKIRQNHGRIINAQLASGCISQSGHSSP